MSPTSNDTAAASINQAETKTVDVNGTPFAYREAGTGTPLVLLHHVTANLDDWDPAVIDALAAEHRVILLENRGVGASGGATPDTIEAMADDAAAFIEALDLGTVDVLGYSLGGMVAQAVATRHPALVRRIVLAATTPAGGEGGATTGAVLQNAIATAQKNGKHPKHYLFFAQTPTSQSAANAFLARLNERTAEKDAPVTNETIGAQLTAMAAWEQKSSADGLAAVTHPALIVNGDNDIMLPTGNSFRLTELLPNPQLSIYPDAGHGAIFQYHGLFTQQVLEFLNS